MMTSFVKLCIAVLMFAFASPAFAQATRTWVSGIGDDANPCSRTAPCKTFAGAISKTAAGGEINALDSGGFGAVTIIKSITIDGAGAHASILAANVNGITINGAGITVNLRNLAINGANFTTGNGIRILQAAAVNIDNVAVMNFGGSFPHGRGVTIETTTSGVKVNVSNSSIYNVNSHGIHSLPTAGDVALVVDNVSIARGGASAIDLREFTTGVISRSAMTSNRNGGGVTIEFSTATATISNSLLAGNAVGVDHGTATSAPSAFLYGNTITRNTVAGLRINGGSITSLGNNIVRGNAGNEAPTATITTQ